MDPGKIIRQIDAALAQVDRLGGKAGSVDCLVERLEQSILDKAFSGQLVPQDPSDEPASKLLERIKASRSGAPTQRRGRRSRKKKTTLLAFATTIRTGGE